MAIADVAAEVLPLIARVGDRLAEQTLGQHQRLVFVQPRLEGREQRHAVLLAQPVRVGRARLAFGQIRSGERLDLVEGLEVLKRLRCATTWLLLPLERIDERSAGMGKTSEVGRTFERAPRGVTIGHQHALIAGEKRLRILLGAPGLVVEQHHRLLAVLGAAIGPHVRLTLRGLARLLEHLYRRLVAMNQRLRQQRAAQRVVQSAVVQLGGPDDPVGQRAAAHGDVRARQRVFHPVQRCAIDIFASRHGRDDRRAGVAAGQRLRRHRRGHDRRALGIALAVATCVFEANMLQHRGLHFDVQLFADFFAHAMHRAAAARTDLLVFGQVVLDALTRQFCRQRLATTLASGGLIGLRQPRVRQRERVVRLVVPGWRCRGHLLGFVECAVLELLAARGKALALREPELLLELGDPLRELVVVVLKLENARDQRIVREVFEIVPEGPVGFVGIHATQDSAGPRWRPGHDCPVVVYRQRAAARCEPSARVPVLPFRVTAHRVDINAVKQPVQLLGRQLDHCLLPTWPHEMVRLEPLHKKPEAGAVI